MNQFLKWFGLDADDINSSVQSLFESEYETDVLNLSLPLKIIKSIDILDEHDNTITNIDSTKDSSLYAKYIFNNGDSYRYSQLHKIHTRLCKYYTGLPPFPKKTLLKSISQKFLDQRIRLLDYYLYLLTLRKDIKLADYFNGKKLIIEDNSSSLTAANDISQLLQKVRDQEEGKVNEEKANEEEEEAQEEVQEAQEEGKEAQEDEEAQQEAQETQEMDNIPAHIFNKKFVNESNRINMVKRIHFNNHYIVNNIIELQANEIYAISVGDISKWAETDLFLDDLFLTDEDRNDPNIQYTKYGALFIYKLNKNDGNYQRINFLHFKEIIQGMKYNVLTACLYIMTRDNYIHSITLNQQFTQFESITKYQLSTMYKNINIGTGFSCMTYVAKYSLLLISSSKGLLRGILTNSTTFPILFTYHYKHARISDIVYDYKYNRIFISTYDANIFVFSINHLIDDTQLLSKVTANNQPQDDLKFVYRISNVHKGSIRKLYYHSQQQILISSGFDSLITIRYIGGLNKEYDDSKLLYKLCTNDTSTVINHILLSNDLSTLLSADNNGVLNIWSLPSLAKQAKQQAKQQTTAAICSFFNKGTYRANIIDIYC